MANERPTGNEVNVLQDARLFVQPGGARPDSPALYYGQNTNYGIIQGVTIPINGAVTPVWTGDPRITNKYRLIRRTVAPPPLPAATFHFLEKRGTLNRLLAQDCGGTFYNLVANCADPSSILYGWEGGKLEVYAEAIFGSINGGNRSDWQNNTPIINQVPTTLREIYEVGTVALGEILASDIAVTIPDVVFGTMVRCAGCGKANDGTNWQYALMNHTGSNEAAVLYRITDRNGAEVSTGVLDITGIGATADPTAIDVMGQYLIVLVTSENAYYYATINQDTGVPGTFTKVTSGFVSTKTPTDILVYSEHEAYISANGGYIYKLTNVGQAVTVLSAAGATSANLGRIAGQGDVIVAAGATGIGIISVTRGRSWALLPTVPASVTITALDVRDASRLWVGASNGAVYYTLDGGNNWTSVTLAGTPSAINDIVFVNDEVGWFAGAANSLAALWWTPDGGASISTVNASPRIEGVPSTAQSISRIAVPTASNTEVAANTLLIGGLGVTTDGFLAYGTSNFF